MTFLKFFKALVAGMSIPAILLPLCYTAIYFLDPNSIRLGSVQVMALYVPIFFGLMNVAYVRVAKNFPAARHDNLLIAAGILLGLLVCYFQVPTLLFGLPHGWADKSIILLPVTYALIFRFLIKWCNNALGVERKN